MRNAGVALRAAGVLLLVLGCVGCGCLRTTNGKGEVSLRGEQETKELIQAMEDTAAARNQGEDKVIEALRRVVAADRKIAALKLTESEKKALDDKYGARREELYKLFED